MHHQITLHPDRKPSVFPNYHGRHTNANSPRTDPPSLLPVLKRLLHARCLCTREDEPVDDLLRVAYLADRRSLRRANLSS
jgi:hypothetical protein